jgi:hypothetical protein
MSELLQFSEIRDSNEERFIFDGVPESCEPFVAIRMKAGFSSCKTRRLPYTVDVIRACILMADLGMATDLHADDNELWAYELEWMNEHIHIQNYDTLKQTFQHIRED